MDKKIMHFTPGDPVPWFKADSSASAGFNLGQLAGRYVALSFFGSSRIEASQKFLQGIYECECFDDDRACFFGVTVDPHDKENLPGRIPGIRHFWDLDGKISTMYAALKSSDFNIEEEFEYKQFTLVLDARLRVVKMFFIDDPENHAKELNDFIMQLPNAYLGEPEGVNAPILVVPRIFEPEFCEHLIGLYKEYGGSDSGFMDEKDGMTVGRYDYSRKRRSDYNIEDNDIIDAFNARLNRRLVPEIHRAFQFNATRIERYIVACYEGEHGGHFTAHRDNTTKGTAHRRFAVTINLNTGEYDGGNLIFPEFGQKQYTAPLGGAVVFSCSLLHRATPVTKGFRYCTLPFLYNDEAAKIREQNLEFIDEKEPMAVNESPE